MVAFGVGVEASLLSLRKLDLCSTFDFAQLFLQIRSRPQSYFALITYR